MGSGTAWGGKASVVQKDICEVPWGLPCLFSIETWSSGPGQVRDSWLCRLKTSD